MSKSRLFMITIVAYHVVMLAGLFVWMNAEAETMVGDYPWCATDGYIYECYYTTPSRCENAAEMAGGSRWCERNPEIYRDRPDRRHGREQNERWWEEDPEIKGWYGTI
jgi:hypothetical protein